MLQCKLVEYIYFIHELTVRAKLTPGTCTYIMICALQMRCLTDIVLHIHTLRFRNSLALGTLGINFINGITLHVVVHMSIATYRKPMSSVVLDHIRPVGNPY